MGAGVGLGPWNRLTIAFAAVAAIATTAAAVLATRPEPGTPVIRYALTFREGQRPFPAGQGAFGVSLTLPDDGSRLAYIGSTPGGDQPQLWVRERDQLEASPIRGTEGAHQPFFSPDGTRVGYIDSETREIKVVSLGGEPPLTLVGSDVYRLGAGWGRDGYIYFSQLPHAGIARVPSTGGEIEQISTPDADAGETRHAWPSVLPSGRGAIVTVQRGDNAYHPEDDVGVLDLETGEVTVLFRGTLGRYVATGHLVFVTHEGDLVAAPFDQDRLEVTGPTVPLLSGLPTGVRGPDVALSYSGRLLYSANAAATDFELVWVDRSGSASPVEEGWTFLPPPGGAFSLSPDERSIAVSLNAGGAPEVWVKEIAGPFSRLAFDGASRDPEWSVDGRSVLYTTDQLGGRDLFMRRADGSSEGELVLDLEDELDDAIWSSDGEWLVARKGPTPTWDIIGIRPSVDSVPVPLVATQDFHETSPALSPDGRFLAYASNESGVSEIYVRPFPNVNDARWLVSTDQGREPVWAHNGRELFYKNVLGQLVSVTFSTEGGFEVIERTPLFPTRTGDTYNVLKALYEITRDDQRFLMYQATGASDSRPAGEYIVVENFPEELKQRVPN